MLPGVVASHSHKRRRDITALATMRRERIAQRVSAGVSYLSMPQPRRGGRLKLCRRFAACLADEISPGLAPWATALTPLRGLGNSLGRQFAASYGFADWPLAPGADPPMNTFFPSRYSTNTPTHLLSPLLA